MAAHTEIRLLPASGYRSLSPFPYKAGLDASFPGQGFLPACDKMLLSIAK